MHSSNPNCPNCLLQQQCPRQCRTPTQWMTHFTAIHFPLTEMPGQAITSPVLNTQGFTVQLINTQMLSTQVLHSGVLSVLHSREFEVRRGFDLAPHETGRPCELASQNGDAVPQACQDPRPRVRLGAQYGKEDHPQCCQQTQGCDVGACALPSNADLQANIHGNNQLRLGIGCERLASPGHWQN